MIQVLQCSDDLLSKVICQELVIPLAGDQSPGEIIDLVFSVHVGDILFGNGGMCLLNALHETVESGKTPADELLDCYYGKWDGDLSRIYEEFSY